MVAPCTPGIGHRRNTSGPSPRKASDSSLQFLARGRIGVLALACCLPSALAAAKASIRGLTLPPDSITVAGYVRLTENGTYLADRSATIRFAAGGSSQITQSGEFRYILHDPNALPGRRLQVHVTSTEDPGRYIQRDPDIIIPERNLAVTVWVTRRGAPTLLSDSALLRMVARNFLQNTPAPDDRLQALAARLGHTPDSLDARLRAIDRPLAELVHGRSQSAADSLERRRNSSPTELRLLARAYETLGEFPKARVAWQALLQLDSTDLISAVGIANLEVEVGRYSQADSILRKVVPQTTLLPREQVLALTAMADLRDAQGRYRETDSLLDRLALLQRQLPTEDAAARARTRVIQAQKERSWLEPRKAQAHITEAIRVIRSGSPDTVLLVTSLALASANATDMGECDTAKTLWNAATQVLQTRDSLLLAVEPTLLEAVMGLATQANPHLTPDSLFQTALRRANESLGSSSPTYLSFLISYANYLRTRGKIADAIALHREALHGLKAVYGPTHPDVAAETRYLAWVLSDDSLLGEADSLLQDALGEIKDLVGDVHPYRWLLTLDLADLRTRQANYVAADTLYSMAVAGLTDIFGATHPAVGAALSQQAASFYQRGDMDMAKSFLQRALSIFTAALGTRSREANVTLFFISRTSPQDQDAVLRYIQSSAEAWCQAPPVN